MILPQRATLFTADAVLMYTIHTETALRAIADYLHKNKDLIKELLYIPVAALLDALRLIMTNNVFHFGNTHWLQLSGTAMGTQPAPLYAPLFFAIYEDIIIAEFAENLVLYCHFIDDIFSIWQQTPGDDYQFL
jgi:hypothetical protein